MNSQSLPTTRSVIDDLPGAQLLWSGDAKDRPERGMASACDLAQLYLFQADVQRRRLKVLYGGAQRLALAETETTHEQNDQEIRRLRTSIQ